MSKTCQIYGVDTSQPVTPKIVRDAIVNCFIGAHSSELEKMKELADSLSEEEFTRMKELNIKQLIRNFFQEAGGDYDQPTKETIIRVLDKLKIFAANFRDPGMIEHHYKQIMELVNKL